MNSLLDEKTKSFNERQREIERLNDLLIQLQIDYEESKNQNVQFEVNHQSHTAATCYVSFIKKKKALK